MRTLLILIIAAIHGPALAQSGLDLARLALDGDPVAIERYVAQCDNAGTAAFIAGHGHRAAGNDEQALELLRQSARNGFQPALWSIALHYVDRHDWVHGYAWGRLAMLVAKHQADGDISEEAWPKQWSWQITQRAARNLRERQYAEADSLTEEIVGEWYPILTSEVEREGPSRMPSFSHRQAPTYPRDELVAGESGWTVVLLDFEPDGAVRGVIPVAYTHREFADRAADAIEQWVADPDSFDTWDPDRTHTQTIEFAIAP